MGLVETPDELASVLAHELTHVTQRHIARGMSKQTAAAPLFWASIIAGLLAARSNPQVANAVLATGQAGAAQNQLNFTRDMEREADRIGFTLMEGAGYAPSGFVAMFNKLAYAARFSDNGSFPYLRSHPVSTARIADMTQRVGELDNGAALRKNTNATPQALQIHHIMAARARVLADLSVDAQKQHLARAEAAAPTVPTLYAGALAAGNLKDAVKAKLLLNKLQALAQTAAPASGAALFDTESLIRWLTAELGFPAKLSPDSPQRPEVLLAALQALKQGEVGAHNASQTLRTWISRHPQDADALQLQSQAQLAQNQRVRATISLAQSQSARLDDSVALAHYVAAQKLIQQGLPADNFDVAIVDSKVRELQRKVRETTDRSAK
jgi:predicted Zn-dependent protease